MSIYNQLVQSLEESCKDSISYSDKLQWHSGKSCIPSDARPCFVCHSDSFKSPGRIAYYTPEDGWYRVVEKKNKIKIRTPRRWCEALVPETYKAFVEATTVVEETPSKTPDPATDPWIQLVMGEETKKVFDKLAKHFSDEVVIQKEPDADGLSPDWWGTALVVEETYLNGVMQDLARLVKRGELGDADKTIAAFKDGTLLTSYFPLEHEFTEIPEWEDVPETVHDYDADYRDDDNPDEDEQTVHNYVFALFTDGTPNEKLLTYPEHKEFLKKL